MKFTERYEEIVNESKSAVKKGDKFEVDEHFYTDNRGVPSIRVNPFVDAFLKKGTQVEIIDPNPTSSGPSSIPTVKAKIVKSTSSDWKVGDEVLLDAHRYFPGKMFKKIYDKFNDIVGG